MEQFKKKRLPLPFQRPDGKKSSSSSRTPVRPDDMVNSHVETFTHHDLEEGVIGGLVDGAKSIFIRCQAMSTEQGSANYSGITWDFRDGSQD
ncbi:hypothetical protein QM042_01865 [Escherichia coli]